MPVWVNIRVFDPDIRHQKIEAYSIFDLLAEVAGLRLSLSKFLRKDWNAVAPFSSETAQRAVIMASGNVYQLGTVWLCLREH